jgi:hypothetical protein
MGRRIIILGAVVVLVAALWSGAWLWAAGKISDYRQTLAAADGTSLANVKCGTFSVGGFPFGFDVTCADATVTYQDLTVTAAGIKASAEVYNPFFVLAFVQSPVGVSDAFTGSQSRVDFAAGNASIRLDGWRIARLSAVVEKPVWNDTVLEDRLIAKADHVEAHLLDEPQKHDPKAGLATLAEYATASNVNAPGFTIASGQVTFEGEVSNISDDVRTYDQPDLLQRWQQAGGVFTVRKLDGTDGARFLKATGNLSLDSQGRVQGQVKVNSKGVVETLGPMIPDMYRGLIVGTPGSDGSYSETVNIAAGALFIGLVPAGFIPPLY